MTGNLYTLPENVCIDGILYAVNTDFRIWIETGNIISAREFNIFEKIEKILKYCYREKLPPNLEKAMSGIMWFYRCGREESGGQDMGCNMPVIDFSEDSDMICAAFYHDYKIDLWKEKLHWWQFKALLLSLNEENKIMKVMGYRAVNLGDISGKEQKKFYRKMKSLYKLKDRRTPEEKEKDMLNKLDSIFKEVD